jgi:hypothetical protein
MDDYCEEGGKCLIYIVYIYMNKINCEVLVNKHSVPTSVRY